VRAGERKLPCAFKNLKRKMEKKFYEMPESEVVELLLENALLAGSIDEDGGAADDLGPGIPPYTDPNDD
jgi:hypothetical protein